MDLAAGEYRTVYTGTREEILKKVAEEILIEMVRGGESKIERNENSSTFVDWCAICESQSRYEFMGAAAGGLLMRHRCWSCGNTVFTPFAESARRLKKRMAKDVKRAMAAVDRAERGRRIWVVQDD